MSVRAENAPPPRPDMSHEPVVSEMCSYQAPRRTCFQLDNGLNVVFIEDHRQPLVTARLAVKGGAASVAPPLSGLAQAMAELMTEGTKTRDAKAIAEAVDAYGGEMDARALRDYMILRSFSLSESTEDMFALLAEVALCPSFPKEEVTLRCKNMLEELKLQRSQARFLASVAFNRKMFGEHAYGTVSPTEESIGQIDRAHIQKMHRQIFVPSRAYLVVVGDITEARLLNILKETFGCWEKAETSASAQPPEIALDQPASRSVVLFDRTDSEQTSLILGALTLRENHPEYYPLTLANQVLGGSFAARLSTDIREKRGYTYGIYSGLGSYQSAGVFSVHTQVRAEVAGKTIEAVIGHLQAMRDTAVSEVELKQAKNMLIGGFARELETQGGLADAVLHGRLQGLPDDYLDTYIRQVQAVSVLALKNAAEKYFHPGSLVIAAVGDASKIEDDLKKEGGPVCRVDERGFAR